MTDEPVLSSPQGGRIEGSRRSRSAAEALTADQPWAAPAKLNLFLHVTGRRADGYHELQTLFQFLDYGDDLYFTPRGDGVVRRVEGPEEIPEAQDIVVRAASALARMAGAGLGADIRITKRIPIGAGLGGGSSDAATTLVALNRIWNTGFTTDELAELGLRLGADVPVFVRGIAAWGEGVGERLEPLQLSEPWYVVLSPPVHVSTREIFEAPELERDMPKVTLEDYLAGRTTNICEPVTRRRHPEVGEVIDWLDRIAGDGQDARVPRAQGRAGAARMSGTGGAVFAAFADRAKARAVLDQAPKQWRGFVARGANRSPLLAS